MPVPQLKLPLVVAVVAALAGCEEDKCGYAPADEGDPALASVGSWPAPDFVCDPDGAPVIARVTDVRAREQDDGMVVSDVDLCIERDMSGDAQYSVTVTILGGTLDGATHGVGGIPQLHTGDRRLMLLTEHEGRTVLGGCSLAIALDGEAPLLDLDAYMDQRHEVCADFTPDPDAACL